MALIATSMKTYIGLFRGIKVPLAGVRPRKTPHGGILKADKVTVPGMRAAPSSVCC